jgi:hypothetical protein
MANRLDVNAKVRGIVLVVSLSVTCGLSQEVCAVEGVATGTVVDWDTRAPLANAYVLAVYREPRVVQGVSRDSRCVKTLGMYTGPDGRFSFPLERMDGYSPYVFRAIASGYYAGIIRGADGRAWLKRTSNYLDIQILMRKQDPKNPSFQYSSGDEYCEHAPSPKDAAAGTEFMRVELREMMRYEASAEVIEGIRRDIAEREAHEGVIK